MKKKTAFMEHSRKTVNDENAYPQCFNLKTHLLPFLLAHIPKDI
jgi:hypothetical protein